MTYTFEQLEHIARIIFQYEEDRIGYFNDSPVRAAGVLASGNPSEDLSWLLNVQLGALPTCLPLTEKVINKGDHPLDFAAAFLDHPEICQRFLDSYRREMPSVEIDTDHYYTTRSIPPPPDPAMRIDFTRLALFHPLHAAWYTPRVITQLTTEYLTYRYGVGHFLGQVGHTLEHANQSTALLEHVATKVLFAGLDKRAYGATDLSGLAEMTRLAKQDAVEEKLLEMKGVYQALGIALQQSSSLVMIAALRTIAKHKHYALLRYFGRSPTVDELRKANVQGMAAVWYHMPWSILGPLVKEQGTSLRAALLKRIEAPHDELRNCLIDHPKRVELITESDAMVDLQNLCLKAKVRPFEVFKKRALVYFQARQLQDLLLKNYPPTICRLIAFRHLAGRKDLAEYVDHLFTDEVREALATYSSPLSPSVQNDSQLFV